MFSGRPVRWEQRRVEVHHPAEESFRVRLESTGTRTVNYRPVAGPVAKLGNGVEQRFGWISVGIADGPESRYGLPVPSECREPCWRGITFGPDQRDQTATGR